MNKTILIIIAFTLFSCGTYNIDSESRPVSTTTLKKSIVYGLLCGIVGGYLGKKYSPNSKSEGANMLISGTASAGVCGGATAYISHKEDLEKQKVNNEFDEDNSFDGPRVNLAR